MGAPSSNMRLWSVAPPRTLKPDEPSEADCTPGNKVMLLMTSTSPISAGIFLMVIISSVCTLIAMAVTLRSLRSLVTCTSDNFSNSGCSFMLTVCGLAVTFTFLLSVV